MEGEQIQVKPVDDSRDARALHGTTRSIIANMVQGVTEPSVKICLLRVGFRATVKGSIIDLELGYSHPIEHPIPEGVAITVADNVKIHVEGPDKQKVGQVAAEIKSYYPVEPYKGKGVRILGQCTSAARKERNQPKQIQNETFQRKRTNPEKALENSQENQWNGRATSRMRPVFKQKHSRAVH